MNSLITHRKNCRLCSSADLELVLPLAPTPVADAYVKEENLHQKQSYFPLDIFLCNNCKHTQLLDVVNPEILFRNYTYVTTVSLGLVEHFKKLAHHLVTQLKIASPSLVVEMGSNDGTLLKAFKEEGYHVIGIDPATEIAHQATQDGIETLPDFFSLEIAHQLQKKYGSASLFIANNVFAHADNLGEIADGIRYLLTPDGIFVFEVSYMVDIVNKMLWDTVYHEHLSYHAVRPLIHFFELHGLELFHVERLPTKGGSLRGYVQLQGASRQVTPGVKELVELEEKLAFGEVSTFRNYAKKINDSKEELINLLKKLRKEGKRIAGYGASATVTTLLHQYELGDYLDFIIDDNPIKQGMFSPGHHIPIFKPTALQEKKPDYVVILAWMYAPQIINKHQDYLLEGGHYIIPNPELKVV